MGENCSNGEHKMGITTTEPVRSRWTPKPEQILILESIFNSGMVNPPKDETVRIRKLLEKFGAVADANVFYWFQNRRSRSRRRQRQLQAGGVASEPKVFRPVVSRSAVISEQTSTMTSPSSTTSSSSNSSCGGGGGLFVSTAAGGGNCNSSSSIVADDGADDLFTISRQMGFPYFGETTQFFPNSSAQDLHYQSPGQYMTGSFNGFLAAGFITVFINGVLSEVPKGPIDMGAMFGNDVMLVHSSGEIVPASEFGILFHGLQSGESYFLVNKPTL